jgi:hypothetical protein
MFSWACLFAADSRRSSQHPPQERHDHLLHLTDESEYVPATLLSGKKMLRMLVDTRTCHCACEKALDDIFRTSKQLCRKLWIRLENPEARKAVVSTEKQVGFNDMYKQLNFVGGLRRGKSKSIMLIEFGDGKFVYSCVLCVRYM